MSDPLPTLSEYFGEWLRSRALTLQRSTVASYRQSIRCYLLPALGHLRLDEIDVRTLDRTYADLLHSGGKNGKPLSPRTVRYAATILRAALAHAVKTGLLDANPAAHATRPRFDHNGDDPGLETFQVWDAEQVRRFLREVEGDPFEGIWVMAVGTGMRRGEIVGLRWEDVDLPERTLHVRWSLSVVDGEARLKATKTSQDRSLRIDDRVMEVLTARREEQAQHRTSRNGDWKNGWGLVFTHLDGSYIDPYEVTVAWRDLMQELDLPTIRLHDLRHTHATLMLQAGASLKVVSERLGHSGIELTVDTYMHVLPAMDADAAERFALLLEGPAAGPADGASELSVLLPDRLRQELEEQARRDGTTLTELIGAIVTTAMAA